MSAVGRERVYSDLVSGLLDARTDPATGRFDAQLDELVSSGAVTEQAARALRFWQRASLRALVDHTMAVLPTALGALDAARAEAEANVLRIDLTRLDERVDEVGDTPDVTSPTPASAAARLGANRRRQLVAELVDLSPPDRPGNR